VVGPEETPVETANVNHVGIVRGNGGKVNTKFPPQAGHPGQEAAMNRCFLNQNGCTPGEVHPFFVAPNVGEIPPLFFIRSASEGEHLIDARHLIHNVPFIYDDQISVFHSERLYI
jgi:hypothetical protein